MNDLNIRPESISLQEENTRSKFLHIGFGKVFRSDIKSKGNKGKNKQVEQHQTEIFFTAKETNKNLKGNPPSDKIICKSYMWEEANIQNTQNTHTNLNKN